MCIEIKAFSVFYMKRANPEKNVVVCYKFVKIVMVSRKHKTEPVLLSRCPVPLGLPRDFANCLKFLLLFQRKSAVFSSFVLHSNKNRSTRPCFCRNAVRVKVCLKCRVYGIIVVFALQ